jgi:hypothetical protein
MSEVLRRFGGLAVVSGLGGSGPDGVHRERLRVGLFWFVLAGKPLQQGGDHACPETLPVVLRLPDLGDSVAALRGISEWTIIPPACRG